ncbi:acetoacetate metabolism regulatory protein AtoC [compost metagenome]
MADTLLASLAEQDFSMAGKKISAEAKKLILSHPWRGNVRELQSVLLRAALWSQGDVIDGADIDQALFRFTQDHVDICSRDVSQGVDLQGIISELANGYLRKALALTGRNKTRAASLLGLKSQQTLSNWMEKYDVE